MYCDSVEEIIKDELKARIEDEIKKKYGDSEIPLFSPTNDGSTDTYIQILSYLMNGENKGNSDFDTMNDLKWPTEPNIGSAKSYLDFLISSGFGTRVVDEGSTWHEGIDINAVTGSNVYAIQSGVVVESGYNEANGHWVKIDHGNGFESIYLHNSGRQVEVGEIVEKGQVIANTGSTGVGGTEHLDFRIKYNGEYVNPIIFNYSDKDYTDKELENIGLK